MTATTTKLALPPTLAALLARAHACYGVAQAEIVRRALRRYRTRRRAGGVVAPRYTEAATRAGRTVLSVAGASELLPTDARAVDVLAWYLAQQSMTPPPVPDREYDGPVNEVEWESIHK